MKNWLTLLAIFVVVFGLGGRAAVAGVSLDLDNPEVRISAFYNGTVVHATGTVPAGSEAVVRVSGHPEDLHLKKKGKMGGVLWMNVGDLTFANAPKVYMLYTSAGATSTLKDARLEYSYGALLDRIEISPAGEDKAFWFDEFLKLKKKNSVYAEYPEAITFGREENGQRAFQVDLVVPPRMGEDDYTVEVFAVKDGRVIGKGARELRVRQVGFPKKLTSLAFDHSLAYGIFSVLIALAAGLVMGVVFKDKGGAH